MISNSIVGPFAGKLAQPFIQLILNRWFLDRGRKKHLRKLNNLKIEEEKEQTT